MPPTERAAEVQRMAGRGLRREGRRERLRKSRGRKVGNCGEPGLGKGREYSGRKRAVAGKGDPSYRGAAKPSWNVDVRPLSDLRNGPMGAVG